MPNIHSEFAGSQQSEKKVRSRLINLCSSDQSYELCQLSRVFGVCPDFQLPALYKNQHQPDIAVQTSGRKHY